jgi:hypothetical protein
MEEKPERSRTPERVILCLGELRLPMRNPRAEFAEPESLNKGVGAQRPWEIYRDES